jgi:hypothetical protein
MIFKTQGLKSLLLHFQEYAKEKKNQCSNHNPAMSQINVLEKLLKLPEDFTRIKGAQCSISKE